MIYSERFNSVGDFLSHLDGIKAPHADSDKKNSGSGFYEFLDWKQCTQHLRDGWQAGVDAVNSKSAAIERQIASQLVRETYNPEVTGQFFDVGLVLSGEPECWLALAEEECGSKVVTVGINACISGSINKRTIIERGAAVCALVKLLESQGKSVRVTYGMGLSTGHGKGDKLQLEVTLKREGDPLDLDTLAFWLVCPDAFRRLCFRFIEGHAIWPQVGTSYGYPDTSWNPEADVKMHAISSCENWSLDQTQTWIKGILKAQGIALE